MQALRQCAACALVALTVAVCGWSHAVHAAPITYTLSGGTIDGTLNGVAFSNANFSMTATADPSAFIITTEPAGTKYVQAATTTMTLPGFSPFQITLPSWGLLIVDYSSIPGLWYGGFGYELPDPVGLKAAVSASPSGVSGDVINGGGSLSGFFSMSSWTYSTTAGDLVITGQSDQGATFTSSASVVPEIDPAGMGSILALVTGALGLLERRRVKVV